MNVLHVVRPAEGGMKNHIISLLENLDQSCYQTYLACPNCAEWQSALFGSGVNLLDLPLKGEISPLPDFRCILKLAGIIRQHKIHVVHTHGMKAGLVGRAAANLGRYSLSSGDTGRGRFLPYTIVTVHNSVYNYAIPGYQKQVIAFLQRRLVKNTHRFITVSQALKTEITAWEGIPEEAVQVIYNGISFEAFQKECSPFVKLQLGLHPLQPVVGTVARLAPQKGVDVFVEAAFLVARIVDNVQFLVVGEGPLKNVLKNQAEKLGLNNRLVFAGHFPDITEIYPIIDVFAVPSLSEGLSITTMEAMAAKRPIVASAVGGIPELISHRHTGFLVPPGDHQALAHGILELLKRPKWAEKLACTAQKKAQSQFTVSQMVDRTQRLYQEAAEEMGLARPAGRFIHARV